MNNRYIQQGGESARGQTSQGANQPGTARKSQGANRQRGEKAIIQMAGTGLQFLWLTSWLKPWLRSTDGLWWLMVSSYGLQKQTNKLAAENYRQPHQF